MRQAGRYLPEFREVRAKHDFFTVCRTPELACEITIQPIDRFPLDAAIIFSDILVVPQAMGLEVDMRAGEGPVFPNPLKSPEEIYSRLDHKVDVKDKLGYVMQAITLTRHKLNGRVPLIGFSGAPWTLMAYMVEGKGSKTFSKAKSWLWCHNKQSHDLMASLSKVIEEYLCAQIEAGAQAVQIFDSWAGELGPKQFKEFSLPYMTQIARTIKQRHPDTPIIVFPKGAHYALDDLKAAGVFDVIGLDWTMDPSESRTVVGPNKCLQGNMDPTALFADKETVFKLTREMLEGFGTKSLIANLGHGCMPEHKPEQIGAYVEAVHTISKELIAKEKKDK
jgi:uroporphyrinogen decarboxylase